MADPIEAAAIAAVMAEEGWCRNTVEQWVVSRDTTEQWFTAMRNEPGSRRDQIMDRERSAIAAYLRARAELADKGPIGEWPRMLRALADEVERRAP